MLNQGPIKGLTPATPQSATGKATGLEMKNRVYQPPVLIIAHLSKRIRNLKSELEQNGCLVDLVEPNADELQAVGQCYFEAIILEIEKHPKRAFKAYKQLKAMPELADLPLILLGTCDDPKRFLNRLGNGLIYYVSKEKMSARPVWQLVKQIHYLTSRYLPLSVN